MSDVASSPSAAVIPEGYRPLNWNRGFGRQVGPLFERRDDMGARLCFRVEPHHANGMNNCHGGMLMTFADMAWGRAVSAARPQHHWVTVRLTCDFLSGARIGDFVEGDGELISEEDGVFLVRGRIWSGDRLLMTGTAVFKTIAPRQPVPMEPTHG